MIELNNIYNCTWKEGYKNIENNSVDLIITSPPYNLGGKFHTGNTRYNKAYNEYDDNLPEDIYQEQQIQFLNACYDKLQEGGRYLHCKDCNESEDNNE